MEFGTFLLMQSPSAASSEELYQRGTEIAQAADEFGFDSIWCAGITDLRLSGASTDVRRALANKRIRVGSAVVVRRFITRWWSRRKSLPRTC